MPRNKTVSDEDILRVAQSFFIQQGAKASTRAIAKEAGISEAAIFQRFSTKEDLFFTAMVPPNAKLEEIFNVQPGEGEVSKNLVILSLNIIAYFREIMPVFLSLISHPSFNLETFLQRHRLPRIQISHRLIQYLTAEADLGRVQNAQLSPATAILLSHLHHLALSEHLGAQPSVETDQAIACAVETLWQGLAPALD